MSRGGVEFVAFEILNSVLGSLMSLNIHVYIIQTYQRKLNNILL